MVGTTNNKNKNGTTSMNILTGTDNTKAITVAPRPTTIIKNVPPTTGSAK